MFQTNYYSGEDFIREVYHDNIDRINEFKYFNNRSDFNELHNVKLFTIILNNEIVGLAHIRKNPYIENTYWLSYLCIIEKHENKGLASILSKYIFNWFKKENIQFETSSYSESGFIKLKPLFNKLSKELNVAFIDKETNI